MNKWIQRLLLFDKLLFSRFLTIAVYSGTRLTKVRIIEVADNLGSLRSNKFLTFSSSKCTYLLICSMAMGRTSPLIQIGRLIRKQCLNSHFLAVIISYRCFRDASKPLKKVKILHEFSSSVSVLQVTLIWPFKEKPQLKLTLRSPNLTLLEKLLIRSSQSEECVHFGKVIPPRPQRPHACTINYVRVHQNCINLINAESDCNFLLNNCGSR